MRQALQSAQPRQKISDDLSSVSAPVGGLNARDSLAAMKPEDALMLDNFICRATTVDVRKGQSLHVNGFGANEIVKSLMSYRASPNDRMYAATDTGIYDVTTLGTVGASVSPSTNGRWEFIEGSNAGIHYLLCVNGTDNMKLYNGIVWADAAVTGVDTKTLVNITNFKFRNFFCQKDTLVLWYLDVNAVQGTAHSFDLGPIFLKGGSLQAIHNWTVDGGSGADDYCAILTSEGECAVYKGTDISNAATWALVGVYNLPRPIGRRCMFKYGGDVVIVTESGIVKLSSVLQASAIDRQVSISDKIIGLLSAAASSYKTNKGWELGMFATESILYLNVPTTENKKAIQYVMNTQTGAWSTFSGLDATCFLELGGRLFYGGVKGVVQALNGTNDFNANIVAKAKTSFNSFRRPLLNKQVKLVRVNYRTSKLIGVGLALIANYETSSRVSSASTTPQQQAQFDVSRWDEGRWAGADFVSADWRSVAHKPGYVLSLVLQISEKDFTFSWNNVDYIFASGFGL